jgi:hypothetical protein
MQAERQCVGCARARQGLLFACSSMGQLLVLLLLEVVTCAHDAVHRACCYCCCMHAQRWVVSAAGVKTAVVGAFVWALPQRSPLCEQPDQPIPVAIPQGRVIGAPQVCL